MLEHKLLLNLPLSNPYHFSTPLFSLIVKLWKLLPPIQTFLTIRILLQAQKDDPVFSSVYKWLKQRPYSLTPNIDANSFLYTY